MSDALNYQVTNIPHLALSEMRLTCPKHKWVFDVSTGECVEKGSRITEDRLQAIW
jgi:nitrite reductase/ring-hydroxylating ferredoxin subunit